MLDVIAGRKLSFFKMSRFFVTLGTFLATYCYIKKFYCNYSYDIWKQL